jgi:hypothetical protein
MVGIATKQEDKLNAKLKHVDIHQSWIRQEVEAGRLNVKWIDTDNMPADGMCEGSVGTVFQLPSPDAIYSRDEGKERRWLPSFVVRTRSTCC